jgi:hypothetical protein
VWYRSAVGLVESGLPGIRVRPYILVLLVGRLECGTSRFSIILVKENAPTPDALGATNGLVLFAMSFTRSFCPAFARYETNQGPQFASTSDTRGSCSWLFVTSTNNKILYGYLWAVIMASIAYACSLLGSQIERSSAVSHDCTSTE